jgi:hypothetical protein
MEDTQNNSQPVGMPEGPMPETPAVSTAPTVTPTPSANPMGADIIRPTAMPQAPIEAPVNNFPVESSTQPATDFSITPTSPAPEAPSNGSAPAGMSPLLSTTPKAPKKKSKVLVLVVIIVAVVLVAAAVFLYLNSTKKTTTTKTTKATVVAPAVAAKPATSADVTKLSTDLDASIAIADATQDITSNDLTNTALGL